MKRFLGLGKPASRSVFSSSRALSGGSSSGGVFDNEDWEYETLYQKVRNMDRQVRQLDRSNGYTPDKAQLDQAYLDACNALNQTPRVQKAEQIYSSALVADIMASNAAAVAQDALVLAKTEAEAARVAVEQANRGYEKKMAKKAAGAAKEELEAAEMAAADSEEKAAETKAALEEALKTYGRLSVRPCLPRPQE